MNTIAAMSYLEESLAASSNFQVWIEATGTPTEKIAAVKARVHITIVEDAATASRPFALIMRGDSASAQRNSFGVSDGFAKSGSLRLVFTADRNTANPEASEIETFAATVESIIDDVLDVSGQGGYLSIEGLELVEAPGLAAPENYEADDTAAEWIDCEYSVGWK